jgi:hypothetical protein
MAVPRGRTVPAGYERRGNRARPLGVDPPGKAEAGLTVRMGASVYRLRCLREQEGVTLDGRPVDGEYIELVTTAAATRRCSPRESRCNRRQNMVEYFP